MQTNAHSASAPALIRTCRAGLPSLPRITRVIASACRRGHADLGRRDLCFGTGGHRRRDGLLGLGRARLLHGDLLLVLRWRRRGRLALERATVEDGAALDLQRAVAELAADGAGRSYVQMLASGDVAFDSPADRELVGHHVADHRAGRAHRDHPVDSETALDASIDLNTSADAERAFNHGALADDRGLRG